MEALGSSETLVNTSNITWRMNPEVQKINVFMTFAMWEQLDVLTWQTVTL
jgi:hypothetical protein